MLNVLLKPGKPALINSPPFRAGSAIVAHEMSKNSSRDSIIPACFRHSWYLRTQSRIVLCRLLTGVVHVCLRVLKRLRLGMNSLRMALQKSPTAASPVYLPGLLFAFWKSRLPGLVC